MARVQVRRGKLEMAREYLKQARKIHGENGWAFDRAWLAVAEAEVASAESDWEATFGAYESAVAQQSKSNMRWYRAITFMQWAGALQEFEADDRIDRARDLLGEAESEFRDMGVDFFADIAREELEALLGEP